jgi:hypothetical protein
MTAWIAAQACILQIGIGETWLGDNDLRVTASR